MTILQLFACIAVVAVTLVWSIVFGIRHWTEFRGKVIAVGSGLALVGLIVVVAFIALMVIYLPGIIALPQ